MHTQSHTSRDDLIDWSCEFGFLLCGRAVAAGDVLFLAGITMTIGIRRTFVFFFKRKQLRGNLFFFTGIVLVFFRWAVIGMVLQVSSNKARQYGFLNMVYRTSTYLF